MACNPFSRSLIDEENCARQATMLADLQRLGLRCTEGHGQHPSNDWPPEPSFLVLGLAGRCLRTVESVRSGRPGMQRTRYP